MDVFWTSQRLRCPLWPHGNVFTTWDVFSRAKIWDRSTQDVLKTSLILEIYFFLFAASNNALFFIEFILKCRVYFPVKTLRSHSPRSQSTSWKISIWGSNWIVFIIAFSLKKKKYFHLSENKNPRKFLSYFVSQTAPFIHKKWNLYEKIFKTISSKQILYVILFCQ